MDNLFEQSLLTAEFFFRHIAKEIIDEDGIFAYVTGINNRYLNGVIRSSIKENDVENTISKVIAFFAKHNVPWTWFVNPVSTPGNLDQHLLKHNFSFSSSYNVFAYDLTNNLPLELLENSNIKEANNIKDLEDWIIPLAEGFESTLEESNQYLNLIAKTPYGKDGSFHHYILYHDNQPVSVCTLCISKAGARIDNVATKTNYLRQGFAKMVTLHAMRKAKKLGAKICYLESSDVGNFLYQSLGFKEIYQTRDFVRL